MNTVKLFRGRLRTTLLPVVLLLGLIGVAGAQQRQDQSQLPDQSQKPADHSVRPTQDNQQAGQDAGATKISQQKPEVKITPREAEELFHSVDEILGFDSKHTALPIKKHVEGRSRRR